MAGFTDDSWNSKMFKIDRTLPNLETIQEDDLSDMQDEDIELDDLSDIEMNDPHLTELNYTLADLFQLLNDDELFKEGVAPFKAKKRNVRLYYENKLATTGHQAKLSGTGESLQEPPSSWGLKKNLPKYNPRYPLEPIPSSDASAPSDKNREFREMISIYKNHYCWLSGIRITPPTPLPTNLEGRKKTGEIYLNYHPYNCDPLQKKQNINQDEHAISFFFMLIFMGGIASIPNNLYNEHYKSFFALLPRYPNMSASSLPLWQQYISWKINNNLDTIQHSSVDYNLNTRTFPWSLHLLELMGLKSSSQKAKFWQNKQKLNYWGIWPSFCYPNQWKSNFDMIRLGFKITENGIRDPYFYPSSSLIKSFVDFSQAMVDEKYYPNNGHEADDERERALPAKRKPNIVGITPESPDGQRVFYYSRTNKGLLPKFGDDLHSNDHFIRNWDSEIAKNNITQVLHMICYIANEFLIDRIFYNCVIVCYFFKYGSKEKVNDRESVKTGRYQGSAMPTQGRARTQMQQHNIGLPRNIVISRDTASKDQSPIQQNEINLFLQKKKNNIEKFIKSYIKWKKINIENEISKIEDCMQSLYNSFTENVGGGRDHYHKKNVMNHLKETKDLFDMLKEIRDGTFMKLERLHSTISEKELNKLLKQKKRKEERMHTARAALARAASRTKYPTARSVRSFIVTASEEKKIREEAKRDAIRRVKKSKIINERRKKSSKVGTGKNKKKKKTIYNNKRRHKKGGGKKKTKRKRRKKRTRKKKN